MSRYERCDECSRLMHRDEMHDIAGEDLVLRYYCPSCCPLCEMADEDIEVDHPL